MVNHLTTQFRRGGLKVAANAVRSAGRFGDRHLVHVNDRELRQMTDAWGAPTVNPDTGQPEFFDFGGLLGDIVGGIGDVVNAVGPIAGPIMSLFTGAPAAPGTGQQTTYTPPIGQGGPHLTTIAAPSSSSSPLSGLASVLGGFFNPKKNPVGMGALVSLIDALYPPKTPSVAQQFATVQNAATKGVPGWNTPLPTATYNNPQVMPTGDLTRYGETGGQDFYPGTDMPVIQKARGGMGRFLNGPDGGQEDTVPANLSDGEYVMDATTVSDLGDGNPAAGAKKLDQMRDRIARHKGRRKRVPNKSHANALAYLPGAK